MTDELLAAMHGVLARYHRSLARKATLDIVQQYHTDLAQRFADEAALRLRSIQRAVNEYSPWSSPDFAALRLKSR